MPAAKGRDVPKGLPSLVPIADVTSPAGFDGMKLTILAGFGQALGAGPGVGRNARSPRLSRNRLELSLPAYVGQQSSNSRMRPMLPPPDVGTPRCIIARTIAAAGRHNLLRTVTPAIQRLRIIGVGVLGAAVLAS